MRTQELMNKYTNKFNILLSFLHFVFILIFLILISPQKEEAQFELYWLIPYYIDFPVSLILEYIIWPICPVITFYSFPVPFDDFNFFILPSFFYMVIGSIWFFFLPSIVRFFALRMGCNKQSKIAISLLILLPILQKWGQLLDFIGDRFIYLTKGINYGFCLLWICLFIWVLTTNDKKKNILWFLLLVPIIYWELGKELYLYIKYGFY